MSGDRALEAFYDALLDDDAARLYDRAPCGYLSTTPDGTIVKVNDTFLTLTGYTREALVARRRFVSLLNAGGRIYHETHYAPLLSMQGTAREIALDIVKADGSRLPVLINAVLERDADGRPVIVRAAVFDATQRREYERELLRAKQRAEESEARARALARILQQTLIPPTAPLIPDLDVAAVYRPAGDGEEVGGDFYDIFQLGPGDWVVGIGDVCGKGAEAAVVTALVRHSIRAATVGVGQPSEALRTVNRVLLRHETDRFCTVALLRLCHRNGEWTATVTSAGHPLPLLLHDGRPTTVVGRPGSLLGVLEEPVFHDYDLVLAPGEALMLYTDGVTEGRRGRAFFGEDGLAASVLRHAGSAASLANGVLHDVLAYQDGNARDDIAVVALRVTGDEMP